jgi:CheY-like chemotaxis protein/AraC-like DNA-binding protein
MKLKYRETNIKELTSELMDNFEYQAKEKNIAIHLHAEEPEIKAWVDPKNFDKVIVNLLSNALKFTPEGGEINIYLSQGKDKKAETPALRDYIEIGIENNGPGIDPQEAEHIFERFYQLSTNNQTENGTGIGLHLTRSMVDLHHGKIWVENNQHNPGCTFFVRIPSSNLHLTAAEMENADAPSAIIPTTQKEATQEWQTEETEEGKETGRKKYKVMMIEDDEEIRQYVCKELSANFQMDSCTNGKDALQKILQQVPDLVISDIMMPEMDGITLCKKIKQNVNINHIPVVLLSAKTTEEDTVEGLSTGADAYITKPFSMEVLRQTVQNLIKGRELLKNNFNGNQAQETRTKAIKAASPDERLLDKVMRIINNNIDNTDLNVEGIAAEVGISRVHLHRKLKELTNQSTRDFIRNMRLQAAAKLLAEKRHSVAEVAGLTGFANVTYFTSAFKDLYGVPPTVYMEQHASSESEA